MQGMKDMYEWIQLMTKARLYQISIIRRLEHSQPSSLKGQVQILNPFDNTVEAWQNTICQKDVLHILKVKKYQHILRYISIHCSSVLIFETVYFF